MFSQKGNTTKDNNIQKLESFSTYSSFITSYNFNFKLYNLQTLDNTSDIYICNNNQQSRFCKTRDAQLSNKLFTRKTSYLIKVFRTINIQVQILNSLGQIKLTNIILALEFITNLVLLYFFNIKKVYQNLENL